jgi:hypothetical protein
MDGDLREQIEVVPLMPDLPEPKLDFPEPPARISSCCLGRRMRYGAPPRYLMAPGMRKSLPEELHEDASCARSRAKYPRGTFLL